MSTTRSTPTLIFFFFFLALCYNPSYGAAQTSNFIHTARTVRHVLNDVTNVLRDELSTMGSVDNSRLSNAISTCLELLDLSTDEIGRCMSAFEGSEGKHEGTGNLSSDLRTWLSAIVADTHTCMEGFEGTNNGRVKDLISPKVDQVNSLVHELFTLVHHVSHQSNSQGQGELPPWVDPRDLQSNVDLPDAIVAADGSGEFKSIMDAVRAAPDFSSRRYVIYIKRGVYNEIVSIGKNKWNLKMVGDGMDLTVISGSLSYHQNLTTYYTATLGVDGRGFIAQRISFRNTAGPEYHQVVALRSAADLSVFDECEIFGYEDSLYAYSQRQFYRYCYIRGTVDFIFGHASAVFQSCNLLVKKGLPMQKNTITAQDRTSSSLASAFSFQFCKISADLDLLPFVGSISTYLGRPWKQYSRVAFMQSYMSDVVSPEGWLEWSGTLYLDTLYYAEYNNYGPGARLDRRVKWAGFHVITDSSQASEFTVSELIMGEQWLPSTGVAFVPGLGN
ncbi:pectinesterase/pectinesterase inhibitor PPE8B-like [Lotus japonicus]|uniref:pectinesterase/pectinesterase inhibitor PPE8B-like n=1 Tax=Lotus japonicus TaxID=34305 RepID=UPI002583029A|nr:pectinesterase/pectinesterase inhibitor PPE8B-like [Lotus japonicus]